MSDLSDGHDGTEDDVAAFAAAFAEAQYWRERHSDEAEAYGKQSQANWERAQRAEAEVARLKSLLAPFAKAAITHGVKKAQECDFWVSLGVPASAWVAAAKRENQ